MERAEEEAADEVADRFEMVALIGRGAYGSVYKAVDRVTRRFVAIKVITLMDSDPQDLERIQKEISFLSECNHPNVVRYLGSFRRPEALWIVMEHCGGGSVSDLIAVHGGGLSEEAIAYICAESLKGLAYLHALGKVHRDIKCGNILLSEAGQARGAARGGGGGAVKLADFGVAAQLTSTVTKRNTFIGTPHWMAPEVIQESRYDGKVDVWALGISAIEMAEVTPPRWMVHPLRVIFMISREPPPGLRDREKWSAAFHEFLEESLQKEPAARPTAADLLAHRFVAGQRPSHAAAVVPLLGQVQAYLASKVTPASTSGGSGGSGRRREAAGSHTGQFSWRGGAAAPARGAGASGGRASGGGAAGARRADAYSTVVEKDAAAAPPPAWLRDAAQQEVGRGQGGPEQQQGGSGEGSGPGRGPSFSRDWGDTRVAIPRPGSSGGGGGGGADEGAPPSPGGIVVRQSGGGAPSALAAALASARRAMEEPPEPPAGGSLSRQQSSVAAQQQQQQEQSLQLADPEGGGEDSYLAALKSAAADRERDHYQLQQRGFGGGRTPSPGRGRPDAGGGGGGAGGGAAAAAALAEERLRARLRAAYEGGQVAPLPFLSAAHAAPLALLGPPHGGGGGGVRGVDAEAHRAVLELVAEARAFDALPGDPQQRAWQQQQRGGGGGGGGVLPHAVLSKLLRNPGLQNLARCLAYHRASLEALPLDRAAALEAARVADDMADALRAVLASAL
ncbi:MAG: kinase-like domain-containing protein [Monoraphidium minutum]|nr:MAG: kinase-like domain-containing protein [Monoraphidium minutum]